MGRGLRERLEGCFPSGCGRHARRSLKGRTLIIYLATVYIIKDRGKAKIVNGLG
jgi:hypothetical protein